MIEHTLEIAEATDRIHEWFRADLLRRIERPAEPIDAPMRQPVTPAPDPRPNYRVREQPMGPAYEKRKAQRRNGKPRGARPGATPWNKADFSAEDVIEAFAAGRSIGQQAVSRQVCRSAISKRLHAGIAVSTKLRERYAAMLKCSCGEPKQPQGETCTWCKKGRKRPGTVRGKKTEVVA